MWIECFPNNINTGWDTRIKTKATQAHPDTILIELRTGLWIALHEIQRLFLFANEQSTVQSGSCSRGKQLFTFVSVCHATLLSTTGDMFFSPLAHTHLWNRRKLKKRILCLKISNGNPWNASQEHPLKFECRLVALLPQARGRISRVSHFKGCRYPEFDTELLWHERSQ